MDRIDQKTYFMEVAKIVARRGNCFRRQVGAVLTNSHNEILSTGYNGVPRGMPHCTPETCPRTEKPSGAAMRDVCPAVHAEINALIQCRDIWAIQSLFTTDSPCLNCITVLLNTSCETIYYIRMYDGRAITLWQNSGREAYELSTPVV